MVVRIDSGDASSERERALDCATVTWGGCSTLDHRDCSASIDEWRRTIWSWK